MRWPAALLVVLAATAPAAADKADALFKKGKKLLAEQRYAEACPTFEEVDKLDPGIGAKLNVAKCYEEWSRLARAHRWYSDAERMAIDTGDARAAKIRELIAALDPDVPRLTLKVPAAADPAAADIRLDGAPVAPDALNTELRVDPGPHRIEYTTASGRQTQTLPLVRGGRTEVALELPRRSGKPSSAATLTAPASPRPGRTRRLIGLATAGAGLASFGIASYLALDARGNYRDALADHCMGTTELCDSDGLLITRAARGQANHATIFAVAALALTAGGVVLYVTAPSASSPRSERALYLTPVVGPSNGVALGGRF